MTRKDYIKFAAMLRSLKVEAANGNPDLTLNSIIYFQTEIERILEQDNSRFDCDLFRAAAALLPEDSP
jgi:hypothetical protein